MHIALFTHSNDLGVNWPFKEAPELFTYRQPDRLWTQMEKPKSGHHEQKLF